MSYSSLRFWTLEPCASSPPGSSLSVRSTNALGITPPRRISPKTPTSLWLPIVAAGSDILLASPFSSPCCTATPSLLPYPGSANQQATYGPPWRTTLLELKGSHTAGLGPLSGLFYRREIYFPEVLGQEKTRFLEACQGRRQSTQETNKTLFSIVFPVSPSQTLPAPPEWKESCRDQSLVFVMNGCWLNRHRKDCQPVNSFLPMTGWLHSQGFWRHVSINTTSFYNQREPSQLESWKGWLGTQKTTKSTLESFLMVAAAS